LYNKLNKQNACFISWNVLFQKNDIRSSTSRRGNRSRRIHSNHHQERSTSMTNTRITRRTTRWKIASTCSTLIRARWLPNSDVGIGAQLFDQKVVLNSNRMTSDLMFLKVRTGVRKIFWGSKWCTCVRTGWELFSFGKCRPKKMNESAMYYTYFEKAYYVRGTSFLRII
jgi:hypothetical protein